MYKLVALCLSLCISFCHGSAFGYHIKVGVPKALELLQYEGVHTRIIGGSQVQAASAILHQAGIIARLTIGVQSVCGGSLISNTRILTAAHCWWDGQSRATQFTIVLGSVTIFTGGTRIDTKDVVVHPRWNEVDITNDVMVAKIARVAYTNSINAIPLPTAAIANRNLAGLTGTISGFGKISDAQTGSTTTLHQRTVSIITNAVCQQSLKQVKIEDSHLCTSGAGNVGTCDGDSGGPLTAMINNKMTLAPITLIIEKKLTETITTALISTDSARNPPPVEYLVGVVSFGLAEGCSFGNPSVYTRVTAFSAWISANM